MVVRRLREPEVAGSSPVVPTKYMGIIYFAIFAAILIVILQNYPFFSYQAPLAFFYFRTPPLPVGVWMIIIFASGYILGYFGAVPAKVKEFSKSRELSKLSKKIEELEKQLEEERRRNEEEKRKKEEQTEIIQSQEGYSTGQEK